MKRFKLMILNFVCFFYGIQLSLSYKDVFYFIFNCFMFVVTYLLWYVFNTHKKMRTHGN